MTRTVLLLFLLSWLAVRSRPLAAQESAAPDWRFGLIETYEAPLEASAAGAAWTRVQFHWAETQADGPDSWTPSVSEAQIDAEVEAGRLVVGLLIGLPEWAQEAGGLPRGLWLAASNPDNLWSAFVQEAVGRYAGRIDHWIIWNEPDIWDENAPGHTWSGTVDDFAQLQRVAYIAAKRANPNSVVHLAAFTYFWDAGYGREQYLRRLLDVLAADPQAPAYHYYFDVLSAHLYFQPSFIFEVIEAFREMLAAHGLEKPLWLVETNAPPVDDPLWPVDHPTLVVTLDEQAAFIPQAFAVALAAGAERVAVYKLKDRQSDVTANPEPFGLLRMNGSPRPAFATYQVATRYLAGVRAATRERWDEIGQVRMDQGDYTTTVLFARLPSPQQARIAAASDTAILATMWGNRRVVQAQDGLFTVDLQPALCNQSIGDYCMIGGTTYYLVQPAPGHALPENLPLPNLSPTNLPPPPLLPTTTPAVTFRPPTATATVTAVPPTSRPPAAFPATRTTAVESAPATVATRAMETPLAEPAGATVPLSLIGVAFFLPLGLSLLYLLLRRRR